MQVNVTLPAQFYADFSGFLQFCGSCYAPPLLPLQGWPTHQATIKAALKLSKSHA